MITTLATSKPAKTTPELPVFLLLLEENVVDAFKNPNSLRIYIDKSQPDV
jgi:hypothetical protein